MTTYKLSMFVGEAPSVSARALGANFARTNANLFLPSGEFWPLASDRRHSACMPGTLSMHRFNRDTMGAVVQNPDAAIRSYAAELSFVKGQVNDEATERTYLTTNDGSAFPRVIDVRGNDRRLGVARPVKPTVTAETVDEFTADEAQTWMYGDFAQMVLADLLANVIPAAGNEAAVRWGGNGISLAGPTSNYGLSLSTAVGSGATPANLYAVVSDDRVKTCVIDTTRLAAVKTSGGWAIPVAAMPFGFPFRRPQLVEALQRHEFPVIAGERAGETVLTAAQADTVAGYAVAATAPGTECANWRTELDALVKEFASLALTKSWSTPGTPPVKPTAPDTYQYPNLGESGPQTEAPEWIQYKKNLDAYNAAMDTYNAGKSTASSQSDSMNGRLMEIQQRTATLVSSIQTQLSKQYQAITGSATTVGTWLDKLGGIGTLAGETTERVVDSRFYVVAFVTDWGEESEPSPVSDLLEVDANDAVMVRRPQLMTGETHAARSIARWRLYRSNTSSTATAWQLVEDMLISVAAFRDDKPSEELDSLQPQFTWAAPPYRMDSQFEGDSKPSVGTNPHLRGLVGMPNGIMAGFIDNTVAFCEPYVMYAWPVEYQVTTEYPVVGMAAFDQTLFVGTTGSPYYITGAHSANMSAIKLDSNQSCSSRRSIVAVQGGVLYASPDGLCMATSQGIEVVTRQMIARKDWQKLTPASMFAAEHEGVYYLFYSGDGDGCLAFSLKDGLKLGRVDLTGTAVWVDKFHDLMYVAKGSDLMECYSGAANRTGRWKTGIATSPAQRPLAWVKVYGQQDAQHPVTVRLWGDGQLRATTVLTGLEPKRLPPGRWLEHEVEVESAARITTVLLCSTTEELREA